MASETELKKEIIRLEMQIVGMTVGSNCPYAFYSTSKQSGRDCENISCADCKRKFKKDKEEDISKEVMAM